MSTTLLKNQSIELGKVSWLRDYDEALALSEATNKPVLLFFQEIPGCATCVNYGRAVLSHPLMVEVIENEFVPLAIHNNKSGKDAEILKLYGEPAWNNPVTRFVDAKGLDITDRLASAYDPLSLYQKILRVIHGQNRQAPTYVQVLGDDLKLDYGYAKRTVYETPCFWSGETSLAQKSGTLATLAGWIHGKEVVQVDYDPKKVSKETLDGYAKEQGFFLIDGLDAFMVDKEPHYYIKHSVFNRIPLSKAQRTKINYAIAYDQNPGAYLSPKQVTWLNNDGIDFAPDTYLEAIDTAWRF